MALTRGRLGGYEFERMVVLFSMLDGERDTLCRQHLRDGWTGKTDDDKARPARSTIP
jgi:hypothetical protein